MYIDIPSHKHNTLCTQFYYVATGFDPELWSSSGHDTKYECIKKVKTISWRSPSFTLKYI